MSTEPLPRPEPVLDAQALTRNVLGLIAGVSAVASLFGFSVSVGTGTQETIATAITSLLSLATLVAGVWLPIRQAKKARALVTPVDDPRDHDGTPLVRAAGGSVVEE